MTKHRIIAALAALSLGQAMFAGTAWADGEDWVNVSKSGDGTSEHWIDANSIKRKGDIVTYSERAEINDDESDWELVYAVSRINCKANTVHPDRLTITFNNGKTETIDNPDPNDWNEIQPDSVGSDIRDFVCKK